MDVNSLGAQTYSPVREPRYVDTTGEAVETVESAAEPVTVAEKTGYGSETVLPEDDETLSLDNLDDRKMGELIAKRIRETNKRLSMTPYNLQYSYHSPTRTVAVKVIDSDSKEVIREIPPMEALDALAKVWELAGILVDERK